MKNERIWLLMARKLAGEASGKELEELDSYLRNNPDIEYSFALMNEMKECSGDLSAAEEELMLQRGASNLDILLQEDINEVPGYKPFPGRVTVMKRILMVAASITLVVWAGQFFFHHYTAKKSKRSLNNVIIAKNGSKSTLVLPDGTKVLLNGGSRLQYANDFITGKREISLSGEAFFEVVHNDRHPFVIHCKNINIEDLGTAFNVKAYPEDNFVETSVIRGKVEINYGGYSSQKVILTRNQKATVYTNAVLDSSSGLKSGMADSTLINYTITALKRDPVLHAFPEISWTCNRLVFKQESLKQIAAELERLYNVTIHFENDQYEKDIFSGEFKDQSIGVIMHALQLTSDFKYRIDGTEIYIW